MVEKLFITYKWFRMEFKLVEPYDHLDDVTLMFTVREMSMPKYLLLRWLMKKQIPVHLEQAELDLTVDIWEIQEVLYHTIMVRV